MISGNIGLAQIEAPAESGNLLGFLSKAGQAAQHAAHLSSQLLTFSKGGTPLKKIVSVGELLEHSAEFSLYGSNLRADFDIAVDLWKAEVDAGQIEQVVNALMLNAREAMPHGGTVRVRARNVVLEDKPDAILPAGHYIKITITDRGSGIPEELRAKIFDPYFTTKATGNRTWAGDQLLDREKAWRPASTGKLLTGRFRVSRFISAPATASSLFPRCALRNEPSISIINACSSWMTKRRFVN